MSNASKKAADNSVPIVAIGSSAGGLEALEVLLHNMPLDSGAALVIIQHQDPTHKGMLVELLQRATLMPVQAASDQKAVEANNVYVIPPNKELSLLHGKMQLFEPPAPRGLRLPINTFFSALADDAGPKSIAVILSGMGSDGTLGCKAIKGKAGLTLAQDPDTAKFDGMPRSAVDADVIDIIAALEDLPERIISSIVQPGDNTNLELSSTDPTHAYFDKVATLLRGETGHDFSLYKKNTVYRRIERRMAAHQLSQLDQYVRLLQERPEEAQILLKELLIGVTSFFRDPLAWQHLRLRVVEPMLKQTPPPESVRVWVPACSTGEEAYSIAIIFHEVMREQRLVPKGKLQIFATDLDEGAIDIARTGIYPENVSKDIPADILQRYFLKIDGGGYRVTPTIRESVIFAPQNVIMDPCFTRLDIIACRNLLIYLTPTLQEKVLSLFHHSINQGGHLFLGSAESTSAASGLFNTVDGAARIYSRNSDVSVSATKIHRSVPSSFSPISNRDGATEQMLNSNSLEREAERLLLAEFSPAAVLVEESGKIIYVSGHTNPFLEPESGRANWNIFSMVRNDIRLDLGELFRKALKTQTAVRHRHVYTIEGGSEILELTVQRLKDQGKLSGLLMVVFSSVAVEQKLTPEGAAPNSNKSKPQEIEDQRFREQLSLYREEMEISQAEARSANEELQSTNEELQSTNEEMTTSKEEMQSMNEELQTLNHELNTKLQDLMQLNNDLQNLMESTSIATIFLDKALKVRLYTAGACNLFRLIPSDIGRILSDITSDFDTSNIANMALEVTSSLVPFKETIMASEERWFEAKIMPYVTQDKHVDGTVITFTDVTPAKQLEKQLRASKTGLEGELRQSQEDVKDVKDAMDAMDAMDDPDAKESH